MVTEIEASLFTVPKVGCTVFKQLLRRMEGIEDWDAVDSGVSCTTLRSMV